MANYRRSTPFFARPGMLLLLLAAAFGGGVFVGKNARTSTAVPVGTGSLKVYFSPHGGATRAIVRAINAAQKQILVLAYAFTSQPIIHALVLAKHRGVQVIVVLDKSHIEHKRYYGRYRPDPAITAFRESGIPMYIDEKHAIAHNKVMLIDHNTIITGSFNFTYAAANYNAENMLVIRNMPQLFAQYDARFKHLEHISFPYHHGMKLHRRYADHHYHHH